MPRRGVLPARPAPRRGRPPLDAGQVEVRISAYCERYGVTPGADGLPPFPSGQRETPQHREWLTVYRAHQRLTRRSAVAAQTADRCALCSRAFAAGEAVEHPRPGLRGRALLVHPSCLQLLVTAEAAGPEAVARLPSLLWPDRRSR